MTRPSPLVLLLVFPTLLLSGCRDAGGPGGDAGAPLFTLLPSSETGVRFVNRLPETPARNGLAYQYYYNGGGVAVGDVNGDGLPDLYFTANMGPNRLYLNRGGLSFEDVTDEAGVGGPLDGWTTGVTFADVNADGRLDIYVGQSGPFGDPELRRNVLFINRHDGEGIPTFTEEASAYGLDDPGFATQGAFFDADLDGDLDLYLMNHGIPAYRTIVQLQEGQSPYETDKLFRNDGGRFVDVSDEVGLIDTNLGFGLGVSVGDLNNDGRPDIYVANDYSGRDYLYLGRSDGGFAEVLERSMAHIPLSSMGSDLADMDGDGWLDLAVLEMDLPTHHGRKTSEMGMERERFAYLAREGHHYQYMANALQWNRGTSDGDVPVFSDVANLAGLARTDWSWSPLFADLDNDGRPDLFVSNGMAGLSINPDFDDYMNRRIAEVQAAEGRTTEALILELIGNMPRRRAANYAYRNDGDLTFTDRASAWGLDRAAYSTGAAYADLDQDGDLDLVVNNVLEEAFVYRNNQRETSGARFLRVELRGPSTNPFGIGSRVRLRAGGVQQMQELHLARGYQSSVEPVLHFGLGGSATVDTVEVVWPDGSTEVRLGVDADRILTLDHADAGATGVEIPDPSPRLFTDASAALQPVPEHRATVSVLDATLAPYPTKREQLALAVGDLDGDGRDDFVFGGDGGARVYLQREDGSLRATSRLAGGGEESAAAVILDANADGWGDVWLASTTDAGGGRSVIRHRLFVNAGGGRFLGSSTPIPDGPGHGTVLAPGDVDGDGRVELFVGDFRIPGTGPGGRSRLYRADGGAFLDVTAELAPDLAGLRTVTGALWSDLDGNGSVDLVVAAEWSPVLVFLNEGGSLQNATASLGLEGLTGWWQGLAVADFDQDGDVDVVAGNLGLNYPVLPSAQEPLELYVGDFDGDGGEEAVPAYHESGALYPWYGRTRLATLLPWVPEAYPTLDAFARATLSDILGPDVLSGTEPLRASTLATSYLENTGGGRLRARPLPRAAQLSAVTGIVTGDFDGDGAIDLVLAGNHHALESSVPRLDGSVGLYLRGDGSGSFEPVPPMGSGLWLEGQVRRLEPIRLGSDRAPHLLAGVAGGEAKLIRPGRP